MNKLLIVLITVLITAFSGCKTSPPVGVEDNRFGGMVVKGSPIGATIFVDDINSGKILPDTLTLRYGVHTIRVGKDGYISETKSVTVPAYAISEVSFNLEPVTEAKLVVLEDFANVSCVPCVTSNRVIKSLMNGTYNSTKLLLIKYHVNFPSPLDPFYQANKVPLTARATYYKIFSTPTSFVDGILKPISSDSVQIKQFVDQQLAKPAKFRITVTDTISGGAISVSLKIKALDLSTIQSSDLRLIVMAVQEETIFGTPPGSNGETSFYDVVRGFFTGAEGVIPSFSGNGQELPFSFSMAVGSGWDMTKIKVVAFVQNATTKEIYQAAYIK
jgi:hypothetical protein